ncbi:MAG: DUF4334 domain-containing protein [Pleurocapsa sp.]
MISTLEKFQTMVQQETTSTDAALNLFDQLDTVDLEFMMGRWKGSGFHTNHPLDGLLEAFNWYGKEFINPNCVHPLLFADHSDRIYKVNPHPTLTTIGFRLPIPKNEILKPLYNAMTKILKTEKSQARMRMMEYRQKISATMIYDHLPIHDIFRKVDNNTVLGLMDYKAIEQPFFFVLQRLT